MSNLTKKDISKKISNELGITQGVCDNFVDNLIDKIKAGLREHKNVKISAFGTFQLTKTPKRIGRNPKTKESFIITSRNRIKLILSSKIKRYLN